LWLGVVDTGGLDAVVDDGVEGVVESHGRGVPSGMRVTLRAGIPALAAATCC
jgi:hypothetical protein